MTRKLKQSEIRGVRKKMLEEQKGLCLICGEPILEGEDVLDHCHTSGYNRGVLHRTCNVFLGKIENFHKRWSKGKPLITMLQNTAQYIQEDYTDNDLHPTHKTDTDKKIAALTRRLKKAKRDSTRARLKDEIKALRAKDSI